MKIFDFFNNLFGNKQIDASAKSLEQTRIGSLSATELELVNQTREVEKSLRSIDRNIDEITGTDYRAITIKDWLHAMRAADVPWNQGYQPSWVRLFDIYGNMLTDAHIQASVDTLLEGVQSKDYFIVDENGERLDDITKMFKAKWFLDFLKAVLNARLWGFGLVQLDKYDPTNLSLVSREVSRKHIRPDLGGIVKQQYDSKVFKMWTKEPYKTWTIHVYESNLGKLNACVRWYIYKTEVARFWAIFNQLFGVPPVIGKTSVKDTVRRENMINALKNFVRARFMVTDKEDEIEQFAGNSGSGSGQQYFENFMRLCDEQISKALLGSTMVLDNGSSKSQSETHAENTARFVKSIARSAGFEVNQELIPRLRKIGFPIPEGAQFIWDNSEKLNMKERAEVVNLANLNYSVPVDTASEFIGIELEEKEVEPILNAPAAKILENYKRELNGDS